jgi:RNA polymerase sigma-70 factor (ECF subfamily)
MRVEKEDSASLAARAEVAALVDGFRNGCRDATEQLFVEMSGPLTATLRRLLGWPSNRDGEVEDMLQNVFLAAWQHRAQFRGHSSIKTWLTRIAINECRRRQRRHAVFCKWWTSLRPASHEDVGADDPLARRETSETVRSAMQRLSNRQREVVVLYYLEELTAREVADVLGLKQGTVEVRLSRARKRLADLLGDAV